MNRTNDKLETLMGKFLDGEISPGEQRVLDEALQHDERARELLAQLRTLHECSREAIASDMCAADAEAGDLFERAWQRNKKPVWRRIVIADGHLRFAAGLAAGLILGLSLHFVWVWQADTSTAAHDGPGIARDAFRNNASDGDRRAIPAFGTPHPERVTRKVDWVIFTDDKGQQWLVEGIREGVARPAVYHGDL